MSSVTLSTNRVGRKTAWHRVTATGIVKGWPVQFGFAMTLALRNGAQKRCPLVAQVTDEMLLQRLRMEALPDVEMQVRVETDWDAEGIPNSVGFSLLVFVSFFSFGPNDLTQMTFGFSRDDAGKFLTPYIDQKILTVDPFESIDQTGVGKLMQMAVQSAQAVRPDIKLGICGEHGGEPESVKFCHKIGLNYVSCSPFRVPIARLAAAQATLQGMGEWDKQQSVDKRNKRGV